MLVTTPNPPFNMTRYLVGRAAEATPDATALLVADHVDRAATPSEHWTYRELEDAVLRVAAGLRDAGLTPGARILIRLDNTSTYALLFFGAIAGGFVPLPTSSLLTAPEVMFLLNDSGAEAIAVSDDLRIDGMPADLIRFTAGDIEKMVHGGRRGDYAETLAEDPSFLVYTSGTTASPKGVLHAQRTVLGRQPTLDGWYGMRSADRMLHAGAFNWTFTLGTGLCDPWARGATSIIFTGNKDPAHWPRIIAETGATLFAAVPGVFRQMLKYGAPTHNNLGQLRHGLMAGEGPPPGLIDAWETATGRPLYEALGMSEISTYISTGPNVPHKPGTTGKPQAGRRIAILPTEGGTEPLAPGQQGIMAVHRSDPGLLLRYWNRPNEDAEVYRGEWFTGGDLGVMDAEGYITHIGRVNDIMKAGGYRVSPLEVEAAIAACPGVADVACAELRVRSDVSVIGAFVVPATGTSLTAETVKAFAAARLAEYKRPREIVFIKALPRTANGKVKRSALATSFSA